jgi:P-type E1-E2 ATPase
VTGTVDGRRLALGNRRLVASQQGPVPERRALAGGDVAARGSATPAGPEAWLTEDGRVAAVFHFAEAPRREAAPAVAALRRLGVRPFLATGDARAAAVVPELIAPADAAVGLLPADKLARVAALRRGAGAIAMVGDGINDAPALAGADLGVALGSATDLTRTTADVAILSDDLGRVPWLIAHARRVGRVARQNLAWAFGYNAVAVALAVAGELGPLVAALAMITSSLAVVANARRLRTVTVV